MSDAVHEIISILLFLILMLVPGVVTRLGTEYVEAGYVKDMADDFLREVCDSGLTEGAYRAFAGSMTSLHWDVSLVMTKDGVFITEQEVLDELGRSGTVTLQRGDRVEVYITGRHCMVYRDLIGNGAGL